jgi:TolB-like protein
VTESSQAVFLSYASQDAEAAQKICDVLRAAGIEVWFDQSELRGGDAWGQTIRQRIRDCRLFVPIISANTEARSEGYFRREWKLAVDRTHDMSERQAFIVPTAIDGTPDATADVPEAFRIVQWTRLSGGETPPEFVRRIQQLLSGNVGRSPTAAWRPATVPAGTSAQLKPAWLMAAVALVAVAAFLLIGRLWTRSAVPTRPATPVESTAVFAPPPHSIAVLPFVNMSGDPSQEYFSDGLTEELLNSLAEINELQVAARTSAFSFKGTNTDIGTIARKLNVGAVLEGSVRRSGNTVRITTQLISAVTGFHLWSHTYDRDLGDVLKLETDIASAVASALKVNLLGDVATKIELGGTHNPTAFDAYLRALKAYSSLQDIKGFQTAIAGYTEAIRLDPNYALAFAGRSIALSTYAGNSSGPAIRESYDEAQSDARKAIALAPDLADGHLALALYFGSGALDFTRANEEFERALALAPGNSRVLRDYGFFAVLMGRTEAGIAAARRAVSLDPLNHYAHSMLGSALQSARQYDAAVAAFQDALAIHPDASWLYVFRGFAYYAMGNVQQACESCEKGGTRFPDSQVCLAFSYDKLGRHADAEAMLAKYRAAKGDAGAYEYATVYAQWGNAPEALKWLETALRSREGALANLKVDPFLDPLRQEPRFQAVMRELRFPP